MRLHQVAVALAIALIACGGGEPTGPSTQTTPVPTSVHITFPDTAVVVGSTIQGTAEVLDQTGAVLAGKPIEWSTSDTAVAVVSTSGALRGVTRGTLTVTAKSGGLTGTKSFRTLSQAGLYGESCENRTEPDVITGTAFVTTHPIGAKSYGCLVVDTTEKHPVVAGRRAIRFETKPGDCSGNGGFDDCANDRRRHEINEVSAQDATNGQTLVYEESIYIPTQTRFRPKGKNALFIGQVNVSDNTAGVFTTLRYLEIDDQNRLVVRTHDGFTFNVKQFYVLDANPFDHWIRIVTEVKWTTAADGYFTVTVDGVEKVREVRPTLPTAAGRGNWRLGIYNAFLSQATEPYENQVIYYDRVIKTRK
jgi:hypothetical protein